MLHHVATRDTCRAAGMVVHPSPGHSSGTLVNAVLFHCGLPAVSLDEENSDVDADDSDDGQSVPRTLEHGNHDGLEGDSAKEASQPLPSTDKSASVLRPGIVHRLDKGEAERHGNTRLSGQGHTCFAISFLQAGRQAGMPYRQIDIYVGLQRRTC